STACPSWRANIRFELFYSFSRLMRKECRQMSRPILHCCDIIFAFLRKPNQNERTIYNENTKQTDTCRGSCPCTYHVVRPSCSAVPAGPPTRVFKNFDAASDVDGLRPPDTHGAVGKTHFVEVTNSHIRMYNKATPPALVKNVSLATFFGYTTEVIFDPRVVYDSVWNRWIVTAEAFQESNTVQRFFIGISKTANPAGAFFIYSVNVTFFSGDFFDFPQLGFD